MRRNMWIALTAVAQMLAGCTSGSEATPEPNTPTVVVDRADVVRKMTDSLVRQGWPVVGQVRYAENSSSGFRVDLQFKDCPKAENTVATDETGQVGIVHSPEIMLKPPANPLAYGGDLCPNDMDGALLQQDTVDAQNLKQLEKQGFGDTDDIVLFTDEAGFTHASVRFEGCDHDTVMVAFFFDEEQIELNWIGENRKIGPFFSPPTDARTLKALCDAG